LGALLPASPLGAIAPPDVDDRAAVRPPSDPVVTVSLSTRLAGAPVASDFLGLSFEAEALPRLAGYSANGELGKLLRALGAGVLRIGGVSADKSAAWVPAGAPTPSWASTALSRRDFARLAALTRGIGWRALLTVNLGHYDPAGAAREASAARASFGRRLMGVEIGNEPNAYVKEGLRSVGWSTASWLPQLEAYRAAIGRGARGTPMASPDASSGVPPLRWVRAAARLRPWLLTDHFYPLTSCGYLRPSTSQLLAPAVRSAEARMLARLDALSRAHSAPLRIDETNDISCHGEAGVSNSFASALWAVDWIVRAMKAGVAGLNFHDLLDEPAAYSPLVSQRGGLHANPEWYALLMTAGLAGQLPLADTLSGSSSLSVGAFLASTGGSRTLSVVLVDFDPPGSRALSVRLRAPRRFADGAVLRLRSASPAALSHVTLGGSEVGPQGVWRPRLPLPAVHGATGAFTLTMPASSAALVTLSAR
jgi:hypothetical protein